jgi:protein involved in polysaccharide export with SLBB domain
MSSCRLLSVDIAYKPCGIKKTHLHLLLHIACVLAFAELLFFPCAQAQQHLYPNSTAIDQADSRAEQEAEESVALSAEKIISILRDEPGLLLQLKRTLVRKAYEQGRILDPEDLTDDAVFRLLREEHNICVIATHEIEDRNYIRAKPTQEEIARNSQSPDVAFAESAPTGQGHQENVYWTKLGMDMEHNSQAPMYQMQSPNSGLAQSQLQTQAGQQQLPYQQQQQPLQQQPNQYPYSSAPNQYPSSPSTPQNYPGNMQRTLEQAGLQPADTGSDSGMSSGLESQIAGIQPGQLSSLLNTSDEDEDQSFSGSGRSVGMMGGTSSPMLGLSNMSGLFGTGTGGSFGADAGTQMQDLLNAAQQANLGSTQMASLQPYRIQQVPSYPTRSFPTHPWLMHRPNPYADVPSLFDLYSQYKRAPRPERFGQEIFVSGTGNFDQLPMDLPAGPDYVVGPGDGLSVEMWGGVSRRLQQTVDREGRISLPAVGAVQVSGRTLGDVQHLVQSALRSQFRDVEADVSLAQIRTVRVYVTGDVLRPGAYDVSSLSTPLNALFFAGGPTPEGSLRTIFHKRAGKLVQQVDVYDLLLHGVRSDLQGLESGDTIFVPPASGEVTVEGMVRRPAIYELNGEKSLAEVLELAGGVLPTGTLRHVDVERVEAHESRTMLRLDIPENNNEQAVNKALEDFMVQDGDKIKISPILPYADKTVYLDGHVFRPGKYAYSDGMKITDLIKSYKDLLPEPSTTHAEIIRLNPPDYAPTVLAFNLGDALEGKAEDVALKPFDTVRVFGRFDFEDPPIVSVSGEVRDPGDHVTNGETHLRDAVYLAGGTTSDALLNDAQVFRKTGDGKLKVLNVNLKSALAGDAKDNILLQPKDRIFIHRDLAKLDPPAVTIQGEVARPGKYPLGDEMTAAELVQLAGGFKRGAYTETADLTRYVVQAGKKVGGEHSTVRIGAALAGDPDTDMRMHDGDVLTIGAIAGWKDIGATIKLTGEVVHPGEYGIREGEKLSSVIERAGGLLPDAYPYGAIFQRMQVQELEEKNKDQMIRDIQDQGDSLQQVSDTDTDQKEAKQAALQQWQQALEEIQNTPPAGRMVIHISSNMKHWENTSMDVPVRDGDSLYIPKKPGTVMVDGSVYNPTAITFKPGKNAGWYLRQAGGPTSMANKKAVFVIRADGSVVGGSGGLFNGGAESASMRAGDMVVVPEKAFSTNTRWKNTLQGAQLAYAVGIAIQVARSF